MESTIPVYSSDNMPAAGVAYDGSVWVTAVSSVALGGCSFLLWIGWIPCLHWCIDSLICDDACAVAGTVGMVAAGGVLAGKRAREGVRLAGVLRRVECTV